MCSPDVWVPHSWASRSSSRFPRRPGIADSSSPACTNLELVIGLVMLVGIRVWAWTGAAGIGTLACVVPELELLVDRWLASQARVVPADDPVVPNKGGIALTK